MTAPSRSDPMPPAADTVLGLGPVAEYVLVTKVFGSAVAVDNVSFGLYPGSVLALVGENGAGKSTPVKTLGGVYRPDGGYVAVSGAQVAFTNARTGCSVADFPSDAAGR